MAVSVRLFYAGQRLNKEFFRDPDADSGSKRRRGSQADDTPLDGKGLLKLFAKGALSAEELAAIGPLMRKQEFIGVSVGLENAGNDVDLRALRNAIMHGSIKPSGVIREVPADADGVCRIPPAHQDTGIAFEMQFNSQEELRKAVELFQTAIQENEDKKLTWYARIAGCCHRHIAAGDFWRKYDVFKYDFDLAPRLHLVFHPNAVSYSLLASWPCRLKGDSVYQRFALQSPFVSPVVETVPPGSCPPRCDCTARSAPATTNSHSTGGGGTAMPAAAAAAPAPRLKSKGVTYDTVVAFETTPLRSSNPDAIRSSNPDALFGMPLPPAYHFGTAGTTPAMLLATSCPSTPPTPAVAAITPLPPAMDVDFLSSLSPDCFLLTNLDTVQAIEKAAAGSHFFADMAWSSAV